MTISYVCLSDLHFGARTSLLTNLAGDRHPSATRPFGVDASQPSPVLEAVIDGIRRRINDAGGGTPRLVLLGDVLELALCQDEVAIEAFTRFVELSFPENGPAIFAPEVWVVPGNHDHHLWEGAREGQYATYLSRLSSGDLLNPPWHVTRMFTERDCDAVHSEVLNAVVRRAAPAHSLGVRVIYPNLGLESAGGDRLVVLHHGHFTEAIYTLMTTLRPIVFADRAVPKETWDIETDNFAWIDFFWSTLGRSGGVGADVGLIYAMLQDRSAVEALVLGVFERAPLRGRANWLRAGPLGWSERAALRAIVRRAAVPERFRSGEALSDESRAKLRDYLAGPVLRQLRLERGPGKDAPGTAVVPGDVTFVFGHTHKPFASSVDVPGYPGPVRVVNDGGWVVDKVAAQPHNGASVVLIDADLTVRTWDVFGPGTGGDSATEQPLQEALVAGAQLRRRALAAELAAGTVAAGPRRRTRPPTAWARRFSPVGRKQMEQRRDRQG